MPEGGRPSSEREQASRPYARARQFASAAPPADGGRFSVVDLSGDFDPRILLTGPDAAEVSVCYERPDRDLVLVGIGEAARVNAPPFGGPEAIRDAALRLLRHNDPTGGDRGPLRPRLLGGFAFDPAAPAGGPWGGFDYGWLSLPRLLFVRDGEACGVVLAPGSHPAEVDYLMERSARADLNSRDERPQTSLRVIWDINRPALTSSVAEIAAEVREGLYEKAVLASVREIEAAAPFDPGTALAQLRADYPHCYLFSFRRGDAIFLGATPGAACRAARGRRHHARPCRLRPPRPHGRGGRAARRGAAAQRQGAHGARDRRARAARGRPPASPPTLEAPNRPELLRLHNIQHLATRVRGRALPGVDILDLIGRLHPTPAVCGWPVAHAREVIARHERFDRGWYAGPIGWLDGAGDGEFAVGLRSALIRGRRAWLFSGAGITGDSLPDAELAEIELKFRPLTSALSGGAM